MKIQKIHLLVVFLLLIVFSVYVLRPSIYPSSYYEYYAGADKDRDYLQTVLDMNCNKNKFCRDLQGPIERQLAQIGLYKSKIDQLEGEPDNEHIAIDDVEDTTAALGLLQTQVQNLEKILTDRFNHTIDAKLDLVYNNINGIKTTLYNVVDENGNVIVDKIHNTDLSNRIKEVIAEDRGSELVGLRADIDTNEGTIDKNKTDQSTELNTLSQLINARISEYQNTNTAELSTLGDAIDNTKDNIQAANSDIKSVQAELEGVDLEQLTYYVGNNIVQIADISRTVATIIPYTEFRDDLRDTYRQQYLSHLETEH